MMKSYTDQHRRELSFEVGDFVFVRIQPFRQQSLSRRKFSKLSPCFFGPYKVLKKIGTVTYELELPSTAKIHPVFHVSLLHLTHGVKVPISPPTLPISDKFELLLEPAKVLSHRWKGPHLELFVQWKAQPKEESSWEDYDLLV